LLQVIVVHTGVFRVGMLRTGLHQADVLHFGVMEVRLLQAVVVEFLTLQAVVVRVGVLRSNFSSCYIAGRARALFLIATTVISRGVTAHSGTLTLALFRRDK